VKAAAVQPSEHQLQAALCKYLAVAAVADVYWFAIPNGDLRHVRVGARLKAQGVKPGVPDICVMMPAGRTKWLELKTAKGRQSPEQQGFEARCQRLGHSYALAHSFDEAVASLREWGAVK
jgi:hypothetical protein